MNLIYTRLQLDYRVPTYLAILHMNCNSLLSWYKKSEITLLDLERGLQGTILLTFLKHFIYELALQQYSPSKASSSRKEVRNTKLDFICIFPCDNSGWGSLLVYKPLSFSFIKSLDYFSIKHCSRVRIWRYYEIRNGWGGVNTWMGKLKQRNMKNIMKLCILGEL